MLAYIALGSNLNNPKKQVITAGNTLVHEDNITLVKTSSLYCSQALTLNGEVQNDYINAIVEINTSLTALQLLDVCQKIENKQQRIRLKKWGSRTIDLDIIAYDNAIINLKKLTIPHAQMSRRSFVLVPLYEIAPNLLLPKLGSLKKLLENINTTDIYKL